MTTRAQHSPLPETCELTDECDRLLVSRNMWEETAKKLDKRLVRAVNNAQRLADALADIELRATQARIASGIGRQSAARRYEFLLGELQRIANVAREHLAQWEGGAQ